MTYLPTYLRIYLLPTYLPASLPNVPTDHSLSLFSPPPPPAPSVCVCVSVCGGVCFVACALLLQSLLESFLLLILINHIIEESKRDKRERNRHTTVSLFCHFFFTNSAENIRVPFVKELGKKKQTQT